MALSEFHFLRVETANTVTIISAGRVVGPGGGRGVPGCEEEVVIVGREEEVVVGGSFSMSGRRANSTNETAEPLICNPSLPRARAGRV